MSDVATETDATTSLAAGDAGNGEENQEHNQPGSNGTAWVTAEFKDTVEAKGWKSPSDVLKSYVELEKYSTKSVRDMTDEERARFNKRLGRPESADEYELAAVMLPKGVERPPDADKAFKEIALKHGLTKDQARGIHEWAAKSSVEALVESRRVGAKAREEAESTLRKEWGTDYDAEVRGVQTLIKQFGDDTVVSYMNKGPGNDPAMLRFLRNIKKSMSDETFVDGGVPDSKGVVEPGHFDWSGVPSVSGEKRYGKR